MITELDICEEELDDLGPGLSAEIIATAETKVDNFSKVKIGI